MAAPLSPLVQAALQAVATAAAGAAQKVATAASPSPQQRGEGEAKLFPEEGLTVVGPKRKGVQAEQDLPSHRKSGSKTQAPEAEMLGISTLGLP